MNDPIVEEVRRVRDDYAARFNYDLDAIFRDIKEQEKKCGLKFVTFPPRRIEPRQSLQSTEPAPTNTGSMPSPQTGPAAEH